MSPRERIRYGRKTRVIDGETYVVVPTTSETLRDGWVRFRDVIPGANVDVRAVKPKATKETKAPRSAKWDLIGLRVEPHDGEAITGRDLKKLSAPTLAERAKEHLTLDMEAMISRGQRDRASRAAAVRKLLADLKAAGRPPADAVRVLMDDTGASRATAYRWINEAKGQDK